MKQRLLLLILTLLTGMGAWAVDYNVMIGGVQITSANYTAINAANGFGAVKSGTVTFDPTTNTLTLTNAVIEYSGYAVWFNVSGRIVYNGTNTITSTGSSAIYQNFEQLVIQGSGTLTASGAGDGNCGILIHKNINSTTDPKLIINGGGTVIATGAYGITGQEGNTEQLVVNGATVRATGSESGSICDLKSITLNDCSITSPSGATYSGGAVKVGSTTVTSEVVIQPNSVTGVAINENTFPDANFRSYVSSSDRDTNRDGYLSVSEIAAVTRINVYNKNIASLQGIECFTAMTILDCRKNQLTSLDLSKNTALVNLDCGNNQLATLDVSQNPALSTLYCNNNQLTSLDVSHNPSLKNFSCFMNRISLDNMDALVESMPMTTEGSTFYVYKFDANEQNECLVPQARIAKAKGWTVKAYQGYNDEAYDGAPIPISAPYFPDADFCTYLSSNFDTDDDGGLSETELTAVNRIQFSYHSNTTTLKGIEYFTALQYLDCKYNNLASLDLTKNLALKDVACSYNEQMNVLQLPNTTTLIDVACAYCSLLSLDVTMCKGLGTLSCDHNSLSTLYANNVTTLNSIKCQNNALRTLGVTGCTNLRTVWAENNSLTALNLSGCTKLNELRIYSNQIKQQAMNDIISALPTKTYPDTGSLTLFYTAGTEGNEYSDDNIEQAKVKRWYSYSTDGTEQQEIVPWYVEIEDKYHANFPSQYFRNYVKQFDTDNNGVLSRQEVEAVTAIDLSNNNVASLKGIEFFTNLETLNCSNCGLSPTIQPDFSKNLKLTSLNCSNNTRLMPPDLSKNTKLTTLNCSNCGLNDDAVHALIASLPAALASSDARFTLCNTASDATESNSFHITAADLNALTNDKQWKLYSVNGNSATQLAEDVLTIDAAFFPDGTFRDYVLRNTIDQNTDRLLTLTEAQRIQSISLTNKGITDFTGIAHFPSLKFFDCYGNTGLTILDVSKNAALTRLQCQNCSLQILDIAGTSLTELRCDGNQLDNDATSMLFSKLPDRTGDAQKAKLTYTNGNDGNYKPTQAQLLAADERNWQVVGTDGTPLTILSSVEINAMNFPDELFRQYVSNNFDADGDGWLSPVEMENVKSITFEGWNDEIVNDLKGIEFFTSLTHLWCTWQSFTELDLSKNTMLEELFLQENALTTLKLSAAQSLRVFNVDWCGLSELDLSGYSKLKELTCGANKLQTLKLDGCTALATLTCNGNHLSELNLSDCAALKKLECQSNSLTSLDLSHCPLLEEVNCYRNRIDDNATAMMQNLPTVEHGVLYFCEDGTSETHNDQNHCKTADIDIARSKGWNVMRADYYNQWVNSLSLYPGGDVAIDAAHFPDDVFRQYVKSTFDTDNDDILDNNEAYQDIDIDVSNMGIADLTGLGYFHSLKTLKCNDNQLTQLDLSFFSYFLKKVECYHNQLSQEAMDATLKGLLKTGTKDEHAMFVAYDNASSSEHNARPSDEAVNDANKKLWDVWAYNGNSYTAVSPTALDIDAANFPDQAFRTYISEKIDKDNDGKLSCDERTAVRYINVNNKGITDLTGIACFENLIWLYCELNLLNTLDLTANTKLQELRCSASQLTSLQIASESPLQILSCASNLLTELSVSDFTGLTELDCSRNLLTRLDVSQNTLLKRLECDYNNLGLLIVRNNTDLETLSCDHNEISELTLSQCTKLEHLYCADNLLPTLDLSKNLKLKTVWCYGNQLRTLDVTNNRMLSRLFCYSNQISGTDMQALVKSLPTTDDGVFTAINEDPDANEQNTLSEAQQAIATGKGWRVMSTMGDYAGGTDINEANFPDEIFRNYVSAHFDTDGNGKLSESERSEVTNIEVSDLGITDLTGIGFFTELQELYCYNTIHNPDTEGLNRITTLDLSANIKLKRLACGQNYTLTSLNLSNCTNLENLHCSYNALTELDLSKCTKLWRVVCTDNQLATLDVSMLPLLKEFNCYGNQLTTLDVSHNSSLESFNCGFNGLTTLTLPASAPQLKSVSVGANKLTSIDVSALSALELLSCWDNPLTELDVTHNTALKSLYIGGDNLTNIDLTKNTALETLSCSNSNITSVDISKNKELGYMDWNNSKLTTLDARNNTKLKTLSCYSNELTQLLLPSSATLEGLYCSFNQLTTLNVSNNPGLSNLQCQNNQLSQLNVRNNSALEVLACFSNNLSSIDLSQNTLLYSLYCDDNQLTTLDVSKNVNLAYLFCYDNQLTTLDVSKNVKLVSLQCYDNQLTTLKLADETGDSQLEYCYCWNNRLTTLDFTHCPDIYLIYCFMNDIKGEGLDAMIASLPNRDSYHWIGLLDFTPSVTETNECTKAQFEAALEKNWVTAWMEDNENDWDLRARYDFRIPGDYDGDGKLSFNDVQTVVDYIIGKRSLPDFDWHWGDPNFDKKVTIADAIIILRRLIEKSAHAAANM